MSTVRLRRIGWEYRD